jgi:hypothetical protein
MVYDESNRASDNVFPVRVFTDADVQEHSEDLSYYTDREAFSEDSVATELNAGTVRTVDRS